MKRPVLHISEILTEVDGFHRRRRRYPRRDDGPVNGAVDLTWCGVDQALRKGNRGLVAGSSLAQLLAEHRGVRNRMRLPDLTKAGALKWLDAHKKRTGEFPNCYCGNIVDAPGETWMAVDKALRHC